MLARAKTGKRSAADLAVVRPEGGFTRLRPPADLGEAERTIWTSIVTACAARHFEASDAPLLPRYVQNVVLAQQAAALEREGAVIAARPSPWLTSAATADKALVALSMRLRISPQARLRLETTAPKGPPASIYELMTNDEA